MKFNKKGITTTKLKSLLKYNDKKQPYFDLPIPSNTKELDYLIKQLFGVREDIWSDLSVITRKERLTKARKLRKKLEIALGEYKEKIEYKFCYVAYTIFNNKDYEFFNNFERHIVYETKYFKNSQNQYNTDKSKFYNKQFIIEVLGRYQYSQFYQAIYRNILHQNIVNKAFDSTDYYNPIDKLYGILHDKLKKEGKGRSAANSSFRWHLCFKTSDPKEIEKYMEWYKSFTKSKIVSSKYKAKVLELLE